MKEKVLFSWSGGKDSAFCLYELKKAGTYEVVALLTTVTEEYQRISMHGVRNILLQKQAESLGYPLEKMYITKDSSNDEYERKTEEVLLRYRNRGIFSVVFADIFLEDLRKHREDNLSKVDMKGIFPIWKQDTAHLAQGFIESGFKAVITCVDSTMLDKKFIGQEYDKRFLTDLPSNVDPCGENGEFHSFVYDGPIFRKKITFKKGEIVLRDNRFWYCDLVPERKYLHPCLRLPFTRG